MEQEVNYHIAKPQDIEIVIKLRNQFAYELAGKQPEEIENKIQLSVKNYFQNELDKNYLCLYATINNEPVSTAAVVIRTQPGNQKNPSGIWGYIMMVYTVPEHRRKGLSKNILKRLLNYAQQRGINAFELHSTKDGEQVYIKEGFKLHNEPTYRKIISGTQKF